MIIIVINIWSAWRQKMMQLAMLIESVTSTQMLKLFRKLPVSVQQFIKFGLIGGFNTILSYFIINFCYYALGFHEQISNFINYLITVFVSYLLNSKFVFDKKSDGNREQNNPASLGENRDKGADREDAQPWYMALLKVYASYAFTELVVMGLLLFIEERLMGIPHFIATFMNLIITVPINFILNKFWAYRNRD